MKAKRISNNIPEGSDAGYEQEKPSLDKNHGQKKTFLQSTIKKIGFALLFLFIGALVVVLSLYLPIASAFKEAQTELDRLIPLETEHISLQDDYQTAVTQADVYKILSNTNLLHIALEENRSSRIHQYIRYVEGDLNKLSVPKFPDLPAELSVQFSKVKSHAVDDRLQAIDELQIFNNDLLLLIDNLE